jgi:endonuclease/exonuclease/phosphatase family metal-dependent hydrolase
VRVVSVNAWGGALFDNLATWLRSCNADVVCLQEVTHTPGLSGWTRFDDGERTLPQRASLFADVRDILPNHQALFLANDSGPVHDEHGHRHRQDFGLGTFVAEHLPVIGLQTSFVHGTFVDHDEWAIADRPRAAQSVRVVDRVHARNVTIIQLHGLRDPAGKHDTAARRAQALRLVEFITRSREPDDLTVVCGDLNLLPHSETFALLAEVGLVDLVGASDTRTSRYGKAVRHASYLLVPDPSAVLHFEIVGAPEVSDHRPLVLDL